MYICSVNPVRLQTPNYPKHSEEELVAGSIGKKKKKKH